MHVVLITVVTTHSFSCLNSTACVVVVTCLRVCVESSVQLVDERTFDGATERRTDRQKDRPNALAMRICGEARAEPQNSVRVPVVYTFARAADVIAVIHRMADHWRPAAMGGSGSRRRMQELHSDYAWQREGPRRSVRDVAPGKAVFGVGLTANTWKRLRSLEGIQPMLA